MSSHEMFFETPHMSSLHFFQSCVCGRGYKIGPVCVCVYVSVCLSAFSRLNHLVEGCTLIKFGGGVDLDIM